MDELSSGEISSQEEEIRRKQPEMTTTIKRKKKAVKQQQSSALNVFQAANEMGQLRMSKRKESVAEEDFREFATILPIPEDSLPELKEMKELVRDYQHLASDPTTGDPNCQLVYKKFVEEQNNQGHTIQLGIPVVSRKRKADKPEETVLQLDSMNHTPKMIHEKQVRISDVNPYQMAKYQELTSTIRVPHFWFKLDQNNSSHYTQEQFWEALRTGSLVFKTQTASFESQLLAESGRHIYLDPKTHIQRTIDFPPCRNGNECIGKTWAPKTIPGFPKEGFIFTATMFESQYNTLLRTGTYTEQSMPPCILCCRFHFSRFIYKIRENTMEGTDKKLDYRDFQWQSPQIIQFYRNLGNCPDGYCGDFMLTLFPGEPVIEGLPEMKGSLLRAYKNQFGRWFVDQTAMLWKPHEPLISKIGENLSDF